jgi:hypothetical protein
MEHGDHGLQASQNRVRVWYHTRELIRISPHTGKHVALLLGARSPRMPIHSLEMALPQD